METLITKKIITADLFKIAKTTNKDEWILLKNGSRAPLFLDTAKFISFPKILDEINKLIIKIIKEREVSFDKIVGIPYGGLPFSYGVAYLLESPALAIRKEGAKNYSTAGELLGDYNNGDRVLMIEDATVTANTALEFVNKLSQYGLVVKDIITILDINRGAQEKLAASGIRLHALFTWKDLYEAYKIERPQSLSQEMIIFLDDFLKQTLDQKQHTIKISL